MYPLFYEILQYLYGAVDTELQSVHDKRYHCHIRFKKMINFAVQFYQTHLTSLLPANPFNPVTPWVSDHPISKETVKLSE